MATKYAVVRTDLMYGTDVRSGLVSMKYMGEDGATPSAIENGNVLRVGALMDGEREVYTGEVPSADDSVSNIVLVASVETMYDERKHNLDEFVNEAGVICRGYRLHSGDIFSVTEEALSGTPAKDAQVSLGDDTKLVVGGSGTGVGKIIAVDETSRYTYYVIKVN